MAEQDAAILENIANNVTTQIGSGSNPSVVISDAIAGAVDSGADISNVIDSAISSSLNAGAAPDVVVDSAVTSAIAGNADVFTAVGSTVSSAINSGADAVVTVGSAITSAANAGASVDASVASSVSSAILAGADSNTVIEAAKNAAASAGSNVTISSDANTLTVTDATNNTSTIIDTSTGATTSVDNNTNITTVVDGNTTTVVDTNSDVMSKTEVNPETNTTTSTTVDSNNNTTTQTTINANTQTTVVTDLNTNTQTTVNIDVNTGEVIDIKEAEIPPEWKPPVIESPAIPEVSPVVASAETEKAKIQLPKIGAPQDQARLSGGFGLPSTFDMDSASLPSRVTEGAIDPLARVKEAQAELERDVMMNQIDPRLLQVMQQRMGTEQQNPQQFDKDIGALAQMLRGEPEAPANEGKYYAYGSEDSIDDILGGSQRTYKEGGYVQPLMAAEGGMALPLLAKSGGALGKYNGREDFKGGKHVAGDGDGQSDDIPAWLADGEFVFPADVVSALGNGSTKAGTDKLYAMMHGIRDRARSKGPKDLPPPALKSPLDYLKSSKRSK